MSDYRCEVCGESDDKEDMVVLTPSKGRVIILCGPDFGYRLVDESHPWNRENAKVYIPGSLMGDYPDMMKDERTVYFSVLS